MKRAGTSGSLALEDFVQNKYDVFIYTRLVKPVPIFLLFGQKIGMILDRAVITIKTRVGK